MTIEAHAGAVFDIGYQRYTGEREGSSRGRAAILKDGIRTALGFGRGGRAKILPWAFITILSGLGLIFAIIAGAAERMGGPGAAAEMNLPSHNDYYAIASVILYVFAAVVAPELLCPDRRNGVISLYLVRPVSTTDYIGAKWVAFFVVMLGAVWAPQIILFLGLCGGDPVPMDYFRKHWQDIPKFLAAGAAMAAYATSLAMLVASFTTRRAYASVFLVGLVLITAPFSIGMAQQLDGAVGQWVSMFSITDIPVHVNDIIFGEVSEMTEHSPARTLPRSVLIGWYAAWTLIPLAGLWWRYKRLS